MALVKRDHRLDETSFVFDDETGEVKAVVVSFRYRIVDDTTEEEITAVRQAKDVFPLLTPTQRSQANAVGKRLRTLAASL